MEFNKEDFIDGKFIVRCMSKNEQNEFMEFLRSWIEKYEISYLSLIDNETVYFCVDYFAEEMHLYLCKVDVRWIVDNFFRDQQNYQIPVYDYLDFNLEEVK